jgi:outer membrane protein TolC
MVDSGGRVLAAPALAQTAYDPAIRETDPLGGPMAALTAFDAQFSTTTFWRQGNNFFNNTLLGGGTNFLNTDAFINDTAISKRTATGSTLKIDSNTEYFASNAPFNAFGSLTSTAVGGEIRQPLMRGAGVEFNRIAGAYAIPGAFNGIVIGRINTDISLIDFESAVRSVVLDVERAYWDLTLAYRDLDAKVAARDATLETWRLVHRKLQVGMVGADEEAEARVREQFYVLQAQVENAYSGAPPVSAALGSTTGNIYVGTSAGVLGNERRLRQLLGLPATDNRLIRPITDPTRVSIAFDWDSSVRDAIARRPELRKQHLTLKRREAELCATYNLRLPQLDAFANANYRAYGTEATRIIGPNATNNFNNVNYGAGVTFSMPLGNRFAHTAIRNAELQVARERAILREQEHQVVHELTATITELDRAFTVMGTQYNRRAASQQQLSAITRKYEAGTVGIDQVLDAQRRWADAEGAFHRSVVDYNRAIADVHVSRGTLLEYDGVRLADAPAWRCDDAGTMNLARLQQNLEIDYGFAPGRRQQESQNASTVIADTTIQPPNLAPPATSPATPLQEAAPMSEPYRNSAIGAVVRLPQVPPAVATQQSRVPVVPSPGRKL